MPRKITHEILDSYEKTMLADLQRVARVTTEEERYKELQTWCRGNRESNSLIQLCNERNITPLQLLLVAMIDIEHPLIMAEPGQTYSLTACMVKIIQADLHQKVVHIPLCTTKEQLEVVHIPDSEKPKEVDCFKSCS